MMKYYITDSDSEVILVSDCIISYGRHNHSTKYVIGVVLAGCVGVAYEQEKRDYHAGEYFVIPPYLVHAVTIYDAGTRLLNICMGEAFLKENKVLPYVWKTNFRRFLGQQGIDERYMAVIEHAYTDLKKSEEGAAQRCVTCVEEAHDRIRDLPEEPLNIDGLANMSHMSKYHFIRMFRKRVGLTPHHYQIQNRIRKSQKLLRQGMPIADVAAEMGFFDQSHFIKFFHRIVGITPKEYVDSIVRAE